MIERIHGTVRGKMIELDELVGLHDGDQVEMSVRVIRSSTSNEPWGEGLKRCAGALADIPGLDDDLAEIIRNRKNASIREVPE